MKAIVSVVSHCHMLKAENRQDGYICDGCKERGTEWRYTCRACNYDMHNFCAMPSPSLPHPLSNSKMILLSSPVTKDMIIWCSACDRSILGLRYFCTTSKNVLHPCCAHLPKTQTVDSYTIHLCANLSEDPCNWCGQRARGWAYVSRDYSIHVRCLRKALENSEAPEFNSESKSSSPAQLPSGRLQLTADNHEQSIVGCSASYYPQYSQAPWTVQVYQPSKSSHGFKGFCDKTKLLVRAIRAILFGDPSSLMAQLYLTSHASYQ